MRHPLVTLCPWIRELQNGSGTNPGTKNKSSLELLERENNEKLSF